MISEVRMASGKWRLVGVPPAAAAEQETAEQDWLPYPVPGKQLAVAANVCTILLEGVGKPSCPTHNPPL